MRTSITSNAFLKRGEEGFNLVPITRKYLGDLETPLSVYLKLSDFPNTFLFESVVGGERFGRYSFIGLPAEKKIEVWGDTVTLFKKNKILDKFRGPPLEFIEEYMSEFYPSPEVHDLPRFCGGLAGYFGYDVVGLIEPRLRKNVQNKENNLRIPDIFLLEVRDLIVVDNYSGELILIVFADPNEEGSFEKGVKKLNSMEICLSETLPIPKLGGCQVSEIIRRFSKKDFEKSVLKAKEYIFSGEVMQVVLGQILEKPFSGNALSLYRALRKINPSPYMYFYNLGDFQVVGASPEILVRQDNAKSSGNNFNRITIRPIAGTRRRGKTEREDAELESELRNDPKELAEHVMLIDLARNDVGKISKIGSVVLSEKMVVEKYSHVMHLVSEVEGHLREGLSFMDVLRATFPAGTLSGAPKIRAMEIIEELEPERRSLYGGACGYISFAKDMDLAIAIRTGVLKNGILSVQAGAGIVYDSIPENEWRETEAKAGAVIKAAESLESNQKILKSEREDISDR